MRTSRLAGFVALLGLLSIHPAAAAERKPGEPVAVVYALAGEAAVTLPAQDRRPLRLFDRLPAGTAVEAGPGSRLALAFLSGLRYELEGGSRATLGVKDLASRAGLVRPLPRVPPLPRLAPIAEDEHPGPRAGAVRIRGERIAGLYPDGAATTLAGSTTLRFKPVDGASRYRIEVQDLQGNLVFADGTATPEVPVPATVLQPGMRYVWTVRTVERAGPVARGAAAFTTLPLEIAEAREALREALGDDEGGTSLALLAEVDRSLGLLAEAREGLRAAVRHSPGDARLAAELADHERRLSYLQSP